MTNMELIVSIMALAVVCLGGAVIWFLGDSRKQAKDFDSLPFGEQRRKERGILWKARTEKLTFSWPSLLGSVIVVIVIMYLAR